MDQFQFHWEDVTEFVGICQNGCRDLEHSHTHTHTHTHTARQGIYTQSEEVVECIGHWGAGVLATAGEVSLSPVMDVGLE